MITLYGLAFSNYYNKVKLALLEKDIAFTEEFVAPSQDQALLEKSPLGKTPFIQTPDGYLSESQAILEYIEDTFPDKPLYPANPYQRAKVRELIQHVELNVELVARRLYGEVLSGISVSQEIKDEVKIKTEKGLIGVAKLLKLEPFALGDSFGLADVVVWPHLQSVAFVSQQIYGHDLVAENIPNINEYLKLIESRPHAEKVNHDKTIALAKFMKSKKV